MNTPDIKAVDKQYDAWFSEYAANNQRAKESILFSQAFEQWDSTVSNARLLANKESLTFNLALKHLKKIKSQIRQIEFSLNLAATNDKYTNTEINSFRMLLNHFILSKDVISKLEDAFDKCVEFGYSCIEVNFEQDGWDTLCNSPVVRMHQDPAIAFWDMNALTPTKTDGRFCGLRRKLSREELVTKYPKYKEALWIKDTDNEVTDYWYKCWEEKTFIALQGGLYKREDLITDDDVIATAKERKQLDIKPKKTGLVPAIYFTRFCNERTITKPVLFPTDELPLVYHPGLTVWTPDGCKTFPFTYALEGAQKLHNYVQSQLATFIKNSTGDKWIFDPRNLTTDKMREDAKMINQKEGSFSFSQPENVPPIRREPPADIPFAMMEYSQAVKQEVDDISGAFVDMQQSDNTVVSGKALKEITENINVIQVGLVASQIHVVNKTCDLVKQMVPRICTEERTLLTKKQDGTAEPIVINKLLPTGDIQNNIKDIGNNFVYDINAGPSSRMQKENTIKYLQMLYAINPQTLNLTADMFARNLETPDSQELELRLSTLVDQKVVAYSQGEIDKKEFLTYQEEKQKESTSLQMQMAQLHLERAQVETQKIQNEGQATMIKAQADQAKVSAIQQDSNTKAQAAIANAANQQANTQVQAQKVIGEQQQRATQQSLDEAHLQYQKEKDSYEHATDMVDRVIGVNQFNQGQQMQQQQLDNPSDTDASPE